MPQTGQQGIIVRDKELLEDPQVDDTGNSVALDITDGESDFDCDISDIESADIPQWLSRRVTPERFQLMCERIRADDGRALLDKLLDNVPVALFILLPLMALMLRVLYPLSKRYYVEHLLFVVHYHAFFFLILTLQILVAGPVAPVFQPHPVWRYICGESAYAYILFVHGLNLRVWAAA